MSLEYHHICVITNQYEEGFRYGKSEGLTFFVDYARSTDQEQYLPLPIGISFLWTDHALNLNYAENEYR